MSAPYKGGEKHIFFQNYVKESLTFASASSTVSPSVILSKGQTFSLYYFKFMDFFWM